MFFVTESGRILTDTEFLNNESYITVSEYPVAPKIEGKVGFVCGIDMENNQILYCYEDIPAMPIPEPTKEEMMQTKIDYISTQMETMAMQTANILSGVEGMEAEQTAAIQLEELSREGATAVQIGLRAGAAVSPQVGKFAKHYPVWLPDEGMEEVNSIKYYPATGMAYCCIAAIQRFSHYTPDVATNNYCPYPAPDVEGIYPYVYGMLVWPGMEVRDSGGDIYTCILTEGTYKLVYEPKDVASVFKLKEV